MKCRDCEKKIVLSFSNDLDPLEQQAIEAHMKNCPACSRKYEEIERDIKWMASIPGRTPKFNWNTSWNVIRTRMEGKMRVRERRILLIRRLLPAAALGILLLGFLIGKFILFPPATGPGPQFLQQDITSRLIQKHMEEVGTSLLEYMNNESLVTNQRILVVEKRKARFLLFQNRNLRALLEESNDPIVIPLLNDLEIVLYETANFEAGTPESHEFIKTMIKEKGIFFRMRHAEMHQTSKIEKGINL
jgi:hypothetical protein